jgi:hypothetical protein
MSKSVLSGADWRVESECCRLSLERDGKGSNGSGSDGGDSLRIAAFGGCTRAGVA